MALRTAYNSRIGWHVAGQSAEFLKYERDIRNGKIPCPYRCEFTDSKGNVVANQPIPLTPSGKPKTPLFG